MFFLIIKLYLKTSYNVNDFILKTNSKIKNKLSELVQLKKNIGESENWDKKRIKTYENLKHTKTYENIDILKSLLA